MEKKYQIPVLQADLPTASEISHWLTKIDKRHIYTNFGPLLSLYEKELVARGFIKTEYTNNSTKTAMPQRLVPHVIGISSGTTAIQAAIAGLNLPPKSKILMPAYNFFGTALAAIAQQHEVIFADVDPQQWILTPELARQALKQLSFNLVLPVALFGIQQDVAQWDQFTHDTGIPVIIDAASALGHQAIGEKTIVIYSLHATKPLGVGEGGLIASTDELYIRRIKEFINFGLRNGVVHSFGINGKLSEYAAAIGLAQLDRWELLQKRRIKLYREYIRQLLPFCDHLSYPPLDPQRANMFMPIQFRSAELTSYIENFFSAQGIGVRRWYAPALHQHPAFKDIVKVAQKTPPSKLFITEQLTDKILCLPFHTFLTREQLTFIIDKLQLAIEYQKKNVAYAIIK